jgi:hypothetical protein
MSKSCKHNTPCSCGDVGYTTPLATPCEIGTDACPNPDPCGETFCAECIPYCGDTIVDLGINSGTRMDVVVQMLALYLTNPGCIIPNTTGSVTNIFISPAGIGYSINQSFPNTPLIGGTGAGAIGTVTTGSAGEVTSVVVTSAGAGYTEGDYLAPDTGVVGVPSVGALFQISIASCKSVLGLASTATTNSIIKLAWLTEPSATQYEVEYKLATAAIWSINPAVAQSTLPTDAIGGLLPNTAYHIRVKSTCPNGTCYSVTILVTTKQ